MTAFASLVAKLWETTPRFIHPTREYGYVTRLASMLPRWRGRDTVLLAIVAHPGDMLALSQARVVLGGYESIHVVIFDSFWSERIPRFARRGRSIDHVWITDAELMDYYADTMGTSVGWTPWGTDALGTVIHTSRENDVLRLGRQPEAWTDDEVNEALFRERGLTYQGRFPDRGTGIANQAEVLRQLGRSKVVLASGNLAGGASYVHPTREYISARFTDAVNAGTLIAGQFPVCEAARLIPDAARVSISIASRELGIESIEDAVRSWTPARAEQLHQLALRDLDWRHRIRQISNAAGIETPTLSRELRELDIAMRTKNDT